MYNTFMVTRKESTMSNIIEIQDLQDEALDVYMHLNESQLKHYFEPVPEGVFIAESPTAIERALNAGYQPMSFLMERKYLDTQGKFIVDWCAQQAQDNVPIFVSTLDVLSKITGYHLTRGILGAFRRKHPASVEEICRDAKRIAVLDDVENPANVGAIFRSAAALGMDAVLVSATCADPLQRRAIRVGVGTVFQIPWTYLEEDTVQSIVTLQKLGFYTVAMALRHDTLSIENSVLQEQNKLAVVLGNEGFGLPEETIAACDATVKIPMRHGVDSLNVAAASAVIFWVLGKSDCNH